MTIQAGIPAQGFPAGGARCLHCAGKWMGKKQSYVYWSGTEYAPNTNNAWNFNTNFGYQEDRIKSSSFYGWAVRSGDVSAVPVPAAAWLFGSGLIGLLGVARQRRS